jgi:uncharacterized protein YeaO (DUF488 family)
MTASEVRTGRVRDPKRADEGRRVLIMRYWPRGMSKERVDAEWQPAMAPTRELISEYRKGSIDWAGFRTRYLKEMRSNEAKAAIDELADAVAEGETITLLCDCQAGEEGEDRVQCHRRLLRDLILKRLKSRS